MAPGAGGGRIKQILTICQFVRLARVVRCTRWGCRLRAYRLFPGACLRKRCFGST